MVDIIPSELPTVCPHCSSEQSMKKGWKRYYCSVCFVRYDPRPCRTCGAFPRYPRSPYCEEHYRQKRSSYYKKDNEKARGRWLKQKYNLTSEDYDLMLFQQGGVCAICGRQQQTSLTKELFVDHNHETGDVRGLLCHDCNVLIGYLEKDQNRVKKALKYLQKHSQ